jgi:hypothetical protein
VLKLQKEVSDVNRVHQEMVIVACDGIVEEHELGIWQEVQRELMEMVGAGLSVIFAR